MSAIASPDSRASVQASRSRIRPANRNGGFASFDGATRSAPMAESELGVLTRQCLSRRIPDKQTLEKEAAAWERHRNKHHAKADWQFTTENARVKLKRLYPQFE